MDYLTKPTSRKELRMLATFFRKLFDAPPNGAFPVLESLEKFGTVFPGSNYEVVDDNALPANEPARCEINDNGTFTIKIRNNVYDGAYEHNIGAYRDIIVHELCHAFLFKAGFTPIFSRSFKNKTIPPYRSVEWQAKALCGEVMLPYDETVGLSIEELVSKYGVSDSEAEFRRKL